jgi:hypothetical protein
VSVYKCPLEYSGPKSGEGGRVVGVGARGGGQEGESESESGACAKCCKTFHVFALSCAPSNSKLERSALSNLYNFV